MGKLIETNTVKFHKLPQLVSKIQNYEFFITGSCVCTCAYIRIPRGHKYYRKTLPPGPVSPDLPVHGGVTFYNYVEEGLGWPTKGCWVGWDYGHLTDINRRITYEEVLHDINNAVTWLKEHSVLTEDEKVLAKRETGALYRKKNKEHLKEYSHQYYQFKTKPKRQAMSPEEREQKRKHDREYMAAYRKKNKEKVREYQKAYQKKRKEKNGL